jgi:hypothetical protein
MHPTSHPLTKIRVGRAGPTFLLFGCISMLGATVSTASHAVRHADLDFTKTAD